MRTLRNFHEVWAYVAISANALVGMAVLVAWRWKRLRGRWISMTTIIAEAFLLAQILAGVILVSSKEYVAPRFHMFYGYVAFITIGLAASYRQHFRSRIWLIGLLGLFLAGLGVRAILQVGA